MMVIGLLPLSVFAEDSIEERLDAHIAALQAQYDAAGEITTGKGYSATQALLAGSIRLQIGLKISSTFISGEIKMAIDLKKGLENAGNLATLQDKVTAAQKAVEDAEDDVAAKQAAYDKEKAKGCSS
jgi:hypothetical protein